MRFTLALRSFLLSGERRLGGFGLRFLFGLYTGEAGFHLVVDGRRASLRPPGGGAPVLRFLDCAFSGSIGVAFSSRNICRY